MSESTEQDRANYKVNRQGWPSGPWDREPDRLEWRTKAGFPGLIVRNSSGALCGYVGLPPGHPMIGGYEDVDVSVHGGLSFAGYCHGPICHTPAPGEPDQVFWLGFDCSHAGDVNPGFLARFPGFARVGEYRTIRYVRAQCESLASQLSTLAAEPGKIAG